MIKTLWTATRAVLSGRGLPVLAVAFWVSGAVLAEETGPTAEELLAEIQDSQRQLRLILGDVSRDGLFDVSAVLNAVGTDPEALVHWVLEETTHVPYEGLVRGEFGVLQDRLGNHLDRAVLLGHLLDASGHQVRLEVMALRESSGGTIPLAERPYPQPVTLSEETRELLVRLGSPAEEAALPPSRLPGWNRFDQDLQVRAASLMERLGDDPGFPSWGESDAPLAGANDPPVRVWWEGEQGNWHSTDLSEAAQDAGALSLTQAAPAEESRSLAAISYQYAHYYDVEVVAERWQDGIFERVTLLEYSLEAHAIAMQAIRVGVVPEEFEVEDFYTEDADQALAEDLLTNTTWMPYLRYGEELILGDLIDAEGRIRDPMQPPQARQLEEATGLLGSISVRGLAEEDTSDDAFIGLSLEVTHQYGEEVVNRLSRPWFSLATADEPVFALEREQRLERAVALLRDSNLLLQTAEPSEALLWRHDLRTFLRNAHALQGVIMALDDENFALLDDAIHGLVDLPQTALQFARHRFTASLYPGRFYIGEPNLLIEHSGMKQRPEGFRDYRAIDLVHVPLHLVVDDKEVQPLRFSQGVLETLLEAELLAQSNPMPKREGALDSENAALHLETAMASGEEGLWLTSAEMERLDTLPLSRLSRQTMQKQLERGQHLYFPLMSSFDGESREEFLPLAWWVVDPYSGAVLGYGGVGWGNVTDYILSVQVKLYLLKTSLAPAVAKSALGSFLVCGLAATMTSLKLYSSLGGDLSWAVDQATGQSERLAMFCANVYNRRIKPL